MSGRDPKFGFGGGQMSAGINYGDEPGGGPALADSGSATETPRIDLGPASAASPAAAEPVKDISTAEFMSEVIEASKEKPVLVDFWAPWCGPCKQLTPALESAVRKAGGKVKLVKMNIDAHPEVAGQMGIQSIPAVVAFSDGQPKDAFMGAKGEGEISQFIAKLAGANGPSETDLALEEAESLMQDGLYSQAAQLFSAVLRQSPENLDALAGFGMAHFKLGNESEARQILEQAPAGGGHAGINALRSALELKEQADQVGDFSELEQRLARDPDDHQARYDLALALNGAGRREEAAEQLLAIIAKDREWQEDGARTQLLKFFEAWGPTDSATLAARRQLSSLLFS